MCALPDIAYHALLPMTFSDTFSNESMHGEFIETIADDRNLIFKNKNNSMNSLMLNTVFDSTYM